MSIIQGTAKASGDASFYDFPIGQSLRFDGSSYLSRNMSGASKANWTFSFWVKRSALGTNYLVGESYASHDAFIGFASDNKITVLDKYCSGGCKTNLSTTNSVFRDTSAFYHIVVAFNSSASSVSDGFKIYVNSQLITSSAAADLWPRNSLGWFLGTMYIGRSYSANYLNGYMAEINFIDGTTLTPTSFGEFKSGSGSVWIPKDPSGLTYGTHGFRLTFASDTVVSNQFQDQSTNSNHWDIN